MSNIIVCALVSDSMLCQHIFDVNSWYSCLLLLFHTLFPGIPFKMLNYQQIENPFSGSIPGENIIQTLNFIIIWNRNGSFVEFLLFSILPKSESRNIIQNFRIIWNHNGSFVEFILFFILSKSESRLLFIINRWSETPGLLELRCLLLIDKARAKDKTYIWLSVRWKTKT